MNWVHPAVIRMLSVRHTVVDFLKLAHIDDVLEVHTRMTGLGVVHMSLDQRIPRGETCLFTARVTVILVNARVKPVRIPATISTVLAVLDHVA